MVEHTREVLASLQRVSLMTERIEYRSRLYDLTGNEEQLARARSGESQLNTTLAHLRELVADSEYQLHNLNGLDSCSRDLGKVLENFTPKSEMPSSVLQRCSQTISLMTDRENSLLAERSSGSEKSSFKSLGAQLIFGLLSLGVMVAVFSFLLRDVLARQKTGREIAQSHEQLARTVDALQDRAQESELLTSARDELQLCVDVEQVYRSAVRSFSRLLEGTSGSLCMINNSRQLVEVASSWHGPDTQEVSVVDDFHSPDSCCGLRSGQTRWRQPGVSEIHCTHFPGAAPERYMCMPIAAHGNTLGVLYVQCISDEQVGYVSQRMDGLRQLVQLTGMAIATLNLRTKLENQSIRDSLTGLFNRHFMQISLERELARAARRGQTLAVFMLDLDHFKKFNDTFGHAAGDMVLKAVAEIFRSNIRTEDIACRYGGEEFTIMLPDISHTIALERAECVRRAVAGLNLTFDIEIFSEITVSIAMAMYPVDGEAADQLLRRADMALYRAKRGGRNQVAEFEALESQGQINALLIS
jgi:diguanylate cyclase (GGDEF)-like protein